MFAPNSIASIYIYNTKIKKKMENYKITNSQSRKGIATHISE